MIRRITSATVRPMISLSESSGVMLFVITAPVKLTSTGVPATAAFASDSSASMAL